MTLFTKPAPGEWIEDPESGRLITAVPNGHALCNVDVEECVFRYSLKCKNIPCGNVIYVEQPAYARLRLLGLGK